MEMPIKVLPKYTEAKVSKVGFLNASDWKNIGVNALIFLTPTITLYGAQLLGVLNDRNLALSDLLPSAYVVGAFEGYVISTGLDYLKKLNNVRKEGGG